VLGNGACAADLTFLRIFPCAFKESQIKERCWILNRCWYP
jgi:hypothetical protein